MSRYFGCQNHSIDLIYKTQHQDDPNCQFERNGSFYIIVDNKCYTYYFTWTANRDKRSVRIISSTITDTYITKENEFCLPVTSQQIIPGNNFCDKIQDYGMEYGNIPKTHLNAIYRFCCGQLYEKKQCPLCWKEMIKNDSVYIDCNEYHQFCQSCIINYIVSSPDFEPNCPSCNTNFCLIKSFILPQYFHIYEIEREDRLHRSHDGKMLKLDNYDDLDLLIDLQNSFPGGKLVVVVD